MARDDPGRGEVHARLQRLKGEKRRQALLALSPQEAAALDGDWATWAHNGQTAPPGDWRTWVIMAGRGFGKTLAGSQWVVEAVRGAMKGNRDMPLRVPASRISGTPNRDVPESPLRIALVGATLDDARRVMVEGKSGLLNVAADWIADWRPSLRRLRFTDGSEATLFSGASPEALRGPEHHLAWCDELAKWARAGECWDMLQLGLRLGDRPRALVTTTPRPGSGLRRIMAQPGTVVTGGPTRANPHLPAAFRQAVEQLYAGTRLGRQELDGKLLTDAPGALWTVEMLERCRVAVEHPGTPLSGVPACGPEAGTRNSMSPVPPFTRTVIGVDPPSGDGTCGIVVCARDATGIGHVLADHSVTALSPEGWARVVADASAIHEAHRIVAERNQGGAMVRTVLHGADPRLSVKLVTATVGKSFRAEPVSRLFEAGKVRLHGAFPELEAELLGMIAGGDYEGPGVSPDRADAMVWALTELMLGKERGVPRVLAL